MPRHLRPVSDAPTAHSRPAAQQLFRLFAVVEGSTGLALLLAPGIAVAVLLGREPGSVSPMVGRVTGVALAALGIAGWGASTDPGGAARDGTLRAVTLYNAGAGLLLVLFGATGKASGVVIWGAGALHLVLAAAFAHRGKR